MYQLGPGPSTDEFDLMRQDVGIVEDTDTATHNIAEGQYVIWKNNLTKASTAIAIGNTLSSSNLTAVSNGLGGELKSISDQIVPLIYSTTENGMSYDLSQIGHFVAISCVAGSITNKVNLNGVLVSLSNFDNKFASSKFSVTFNGLDNIYNSKRIILEKDTGNVKSIAGYAISDTPRFTLYGVIDTYS